MKTKLLLCLMLLLSVVGLSAQSSRKAIVENICRSGGSYYAYPTVSTRLTATPKGYEPFYFTHYGRHGSRWLGSDRQYVTVKNILDSAAQCGALTPLGLNLRDRIDTLCAEAYGRYGDLSRIGAGQHRAIAQRMYTNFPEIFANDNIEVDARSTVVRRCMLSMTSACTELKGLNPTMHIDYDATYRDMWYMNNSDNEAFWDYNRTSRADSLFEVFQSRHTKPARFVSSLFRNPDFLKQVSIGGKQPTDYTVKFYQYVFAIASDAQDDDSSMTFYDLFTTEELYDLWCVENGRWYKYFGNSRLSDGVMPYIVSSLMLDILDRANAAIAAGGKSVCLRYGHDSVVLPLVIMLGLNGYDYSTEDYETVADRVPTFKIIPMAANVQIVLYRNHSGDVLLKVLLNEKEASLPIPTDCAPYYHWNDFEKYYRSRIAEYDARVPAKLRSDYKQ